MPMRTPRTPVDRRRADSETSLTSKALFRRGVSVQTRRAAAGVFFALAALFGSMQSTVVFAQSASYPAMAPLRSYLEASDTLEIALARTAAPPSISDNADILTLDRTGYKTAIKGNNGFVCLVERSWAMGFADPEFWNPNFRAPICNNRTAARTVQPPYIERTKWVLGGITMAEMIARTRAQLSSGTFILPEAGAMSYMMSKRTRLHDADGHWHSHLMFYLARGDAAAWGANFKGSPLLADSSTIFGQEDTPEPMTVFFLPVAHWSDGTPSGEVR